MFLDITESKMMLSRVLGEYERSKFAAIKSFLKPGGVFLDVGANKGDFSLFAAKIVGSKGCVLAFEPEPSNVYWLKKNIQANKKKNIHVFEVALDNRNGTGELFLGEKSGWHSLLANARATSEVSAVEVRTIDHLFYEINFQRSITVMKIDVEGAELRVLEGAEQLLAREDLVLLMDLHPQYGVEVRSVIDYLKRHGLRAFRELPPFDELVRHEHYGKCTSIIAHK